MSSQRSDKVTLARIAEVIGVSMTTVSNAYNHPEKLSSELRDRILETARELGYRGPNVVARSLRSGKTGAVGWVVRESLSFAVADPATAPFLRGLAGQLESASLSLLVVAGGAGVPTEELVSNAIVDSFVVFSMADDDPVVQAVLERGLPFVVVEQPLLPDVPIVEIDDAGGAESVATHLVELGHKQFGLITLQSSWMSPEGPVELSEDGEIRYRLTRERLRGYGTALAKAKIDIHQVPAYEGRSSIETGARAMEWLLRQSPRPTAVLAMSDLLAVGAMQAIQNAGLRVPEDISVAGFDDIPPPIETMPALTSVSQPFEKKGEVAGEMLLNFSTPHKRVVLPTSLIVRESTGSAPSKTRVK